MAGWFPLGTNGATTFNTLKLGALGFVTGLKIAPDGTMVCRTDVGGAYTWDGSKWVQAVTTNSFPDWSLGGFTGAYEIVPAPSLPSTLYLYFSDGFSYGYVYKSTDSGATWVRCANFTSAIAKPNGNTTKYINHKMAVDPANPNIVYVGTPSNGLRKTADGGATWSTVSAVGTGGTAGDGTGGGHVICFDPASSVVGNVTQGIYVMTFGGGVYHSANGGSSWTLLNSSGMPTAIVSMTIDQFGFLWVDDTSTLNLWNGSAWSKPLGASTIAVVAVDPASASQATSHVFAVTSKGELYISTNGGGSWVGPAPFTIASATIPAIQWSADQSLSADMIEFNPISGLLVMSGGPGVFTTTPPVTNTAFVWTAFSVGIEELVIDWIVSPPGGNPVIVAWDRPVWVVTNPDAYPAQYYPNHANLIMQGCGVDWASSDPTTLVAIIGGTAASQAADISGILTNGGTTYTKFAALPATFSQSDGRGGCIAASTPLNFVWVVSDCASPNWFGGPYYTIDGGATWNVCSTGQAGQGGWHAAYYLSRQNVCADRVDANTFYLFNDGSGTVAADNGIYKSTDGGVTWTKPFTGQLGALTNFRFQMRSVPGRSGHLFATGGSDTVTSANAGQFFYRSTDHGATWTAVSNVLEVWSFGFGKAKPGQSYPAIFIYGWVNGVIGLWRSDDNCVTWVKLCNGPSGLPGGWFDQLTVLEGDSNTYGTVYLGFAGTGAKDGKVQ